MRRIPVRRPAKRLLGTADRLAGIRADNPIRGACIVVTRTQQVLQFDTFGTAQWQVVFRPGAIDQACAIEALGQQADCQCIGRRVVVLEDRPEVIEDQERRATVAGRQQQGGRQLFRAGRGLTAIRQDHAQLTPFGNGLAHRAIGQGVVESARQLHFEAPRLTTLPA